MPLLPSTVLSSSSGESGNPIAIAVAVPIVVVALIAAVGAYYYYYVRKLPITDSSSEIDDINYDEYYKEDNDGIVNEQEIGV
jgi:hypothetical protein